MLLFTKVHGWPQFYMMIGDKPHIISTSSNKEIKTKENPQGLYWCGTIVEQKRLDTATEVVMPFDMDDLQVLRHVQQNSGVI